MEGLQEILACLLCIFLCVSDSSGAYSPDDYQEKAVPPLSSWREIKNGNTNDFLEDEFSNTKSLKGLKEKWDLPPEEKFANDKSLLDKWKAIGDKILEDDEKQTIPGLKEKWDTKNSAVKNYDTLVEKNEFNLFDIDRTEPKRKRTRTSSSDDESFQSESSTRSLINRLKDIASSQARIIFLLKRLETKYGNNKQCGLNDMPYQVDDIDDFDMESLSISDKATNSLGDKVDAMLPRLRTHRSASRPNPYIRQLRTNLAIAKAKRARILKLIREIDNYKKFVSTRQQDGTDSIGSLHQQLCAEVKAEAKEVEDTSKQVENNMKKKKQHIKEILRELLTAVAPTQPKGTPSPTLPRTQPALEIPTNYTRKGNSSNSTSNATIIRVTTVTTKAPTVQSPTQPPVRVAGHVNKERCELCEELDDEEVCGDNGKTYRTLCHAVNCAGLALRDIATGACVTKDMCAHSKCGSNQICIPMVHGPCLTLYSSDGYKKLPCRQYVCENINCDQNNASSVCGMDGNSYNSLCELYRSGQRLAYTGPCRPQVCKGEVCGMDKNTYKSACHARTHKTKVDYSGKCFSADFGVPSSEQTSTCALIRKHGRCKEEALCSKPVLPIDACCPICGGIAEVALQAAGLSKYIFHHDEQNHLYAVENLLRDLLPPNAIKKCVLFSSLTDSGNISLVLEALNPGDHQECRDALLTIINSINRNKSVRNVHPKFEMAAFIDLESWARNQLLNVQDQLLEASDNLKNKALNELGKKVQDLDNKVPSSRGCQSVLSAQTFIYVSLLLHMHQ